MVLHEGALNATPGQDAGALGWCDMSKSEQTNQTKQTKQTIWQRITAHLRAPTDAGSAYIAPIAPHQKALYDLHPELSDRLRIYSSRGNDQQWHSPSYSYEQAIADSEQNVWMKKAVKIISDAVAPLTLQVMQDDEPIKNTPLAATLAKPNPSQSTPDLWREWTIDMMLGGETGLELVPSRGGQLAEMWGRWPTIFNVVPDKTQKRYRVVAGYIIDDNEGDPYTLAPDEFIHFKLTNPRNRWRGISPFIANKIGLRIDRYARHWSADFFENGALPAVAITAPQGTTRSERDALLAEVLAVYRGSQNGVIVLEEGVTGVEPISHPPKDVAFVEQRSMSRDEVGAAAGIPDILMGFGNDSYDTPDKRVNAEATMWSLTIEPMVRYRDQVLTSHFRSIGALPGNQEIRTDLSGVAALKPRSQIYQYHIDGGMVTRNEVRATLGIPPEDDDAEGQRFYTLSQKLALMQRAVNAGYDPVAASELAELDTPPAPLDDSAGGDGSGDGDDFRQLFIRPRVKGINPGMVIRRNAAIDTSYGGEWHTAAWGEWVKRTDPHERRMGIAVARMMERLRRHVLARVDAQKAALSVAANGNGHVRLVQKSITDIAEDPFDRDDWENEARRMIRSELRRTVADAGRRALADVGVSLAFDLLDPNVARFLREREQRFAKRVTQTTWDMLKDTLARGIEAGETIEQLAARVEATMDLRANQSSTVIARTETIGAANGGAVQAWQQTDGLVTGKMWLATLDDRTRDTHADAHGQEVGLGEDFEVGDGSGPAPGQIGLPEEDIQCRCALVPIVEGE